MFLWDCGVGAEVASTFGNDIFRQLCQFRIVPLKRNVRAVLDVKHKQSFVTISANHHSWLFRTTYSQDQISDFRKPPELAKVGAVRSR